MAIKSLSISKAKELRKLSNKKERDSKNMFLAEGEKCVKDLLGYFQLSMLICREEWIKKNPSIIKEYEDFIFQTDKRIMEIISSMNSLPEVIAVFYKPTIDIDIESLDENKLYLLLDEIQDPGNLGTIIRTCDWFGVYNIFASRNTVDVYGSKVVQSTMGSLARVRIFYTDLKNLILKNRNLKLIGTLLNGKPINSVELDNRGFLIMGNEGKGISMELQELIDIPVTIPPTNPVNHPDSLNVAIATAITLSQIRER